MNLLKKVLKPIWHRCPYSWQRNYLFNKIYGYFPSRRSPKIMDKKLLALQSQYYYRKDISTSMDKYEVRIYLQEIGYESLLNELY